MGCGQFFSFSLISTQSAYHGRALNSIKPPIKLHPGRSSGGLNQLNSKYKIFKNVCRKKTYRSDDISQIRRAAKLTYVHAA